MADGHRGKKRNRVCGEAELSKAARSPRRLKSGSGEDLKQVSEETEDYRKRLNLLYNVGRKVGSVAEVPALLDEIMRMTIRTLRASASSVLLVDQSKGDIYFEVAEGKAERSLKQARLSLDTGIVGWVARNGKPVISNEVTRDERFNTEIDKLTGFTTKSVLAVPMVWEHTVIGVLEVLNKAGGSGFDERDLEVLSALASMAASVISNARLHQAVVDGYASTIKALVAAIDAKDPYTSGHSQRVMEYVLLGAGAFSLSQVEQQALEFGSLLHDIGKIGIDDSILRKSDYLTREEWLVVSKHPLIGARIVAEVSFLNGAKDVILHHHERYDGSGYPEGLKGEAIPIGARLVAVADTFDAMTSNRPYRAALSAVDALVMLSKLAGTQFCPQAVTALVSVFEKRQVEESTKAYSGAVQLPALS